MKITSISVQARNPDRVNISIDGKYRLSLDVWQITELGLRNGAEVTPEELAKWEEESAFGKLYGRALEYTMIRPHSAKEVRDYLWRKTLTRKQRVTSHDLSVLSARQAESRPVRPVAQPGGVTTSRRKKPKPINEGDVNSAPASYLMPRDSVKIIEKPGVSQEIADRVYERLIDKGYIDDEKFARFWLENRNLRKGASQRKLIAELRGKGVEQGIIDALLPVSGRSDANELIKIITKKRTRYNDDKKLIQYLMRQGFSYDDIRTALTTYEQT